MQKKVVEIMPHMENSWMSNRIARIRVNNRNVRVR
jgi:hypothetical protein